MVLPYLSLLVFGHIFHFFRGELIKVKLCLCKLQNLNQNMKILNKFTNC
jgi:hypothetical protein